MIDVETKLREGLDAFAAETSAAVSPPPVASIALRAGTRSMPQRRWPKLVAAVVVGVAVTTGTAAAVGVLPGPVESMLDEFRSWGFRADQGAERMATVTAGDLTYEVWRAPLDGGGQCVYDRVIGPGGDIEHGGASHCHAEAPSPRSAAHFGELSYPETVFDNSNGRDPESARLHSVASGQLPLGATEVVFEFDNSTTLAVAPQRDGYFITTFPDVVDGSRITAVRAVDGEGHVVATG
jgi:hypothetical protein